MQHVVCVWEGIGGGCGGVQKGGRSPWVYFLGPSELRGVSSLWAAKLRHGAGQDAPASKAGLPTLRPQEPFYISQPPHFERK